MISSSSPSSSTRARNIRVAAVFGVAALALVGCSSTSASPSAVAADCSPEHDGLTTFTEGTLTVGVPENPPYTKTEGSSASGLEIGVIEKLAAAECLDVAYVPITYANGIPMISEQKRTDIATGGWYVTEARAEQVGFTTPTFFDTMGIVSKDGATTVEELTEIGAVGTGTGFSWQDDMTKVLGSKLTLYPGTVEMKQDLESGRIQAMLDGYAVAVEAFKGTDWKVEPAAEDSRIAITTDMPKIAFPVSKDNRKLSDAFSELIDGYREDGTLADLLAEYDLPADLLVPADQAAASIR
jgi:polar amino acid transport system substrate-binding protein